MSNKIYPNNPFYIPPPSLDFDDSFLRRPDASTNFQSCPVPRSSPPTRQERQITLAPFNSRRPEPDYCRAPDASTNFQPVPWPRSSPSVRQDAPIVPQPFSNRRPDPGHLRAPDHTTNFQSAPAPRSSPPIRQELSQHMAGHHQRAERAGQLDNVAGPLAIPAAPPGVDRPYVYDKEGGYAEQRLHGYVPQVGKTHLHPAPYSGITFGAGIDIAQHTRAELIAMGISASSLAVFPDEAFARPVTKWTHDAKGHTRRSITMIKGALGNAAQKILDAMEKPLDLTENEASYDSALTFNQMARTTQHVYDHAAGKPVFDTLPGNIKTALIDIGYSKGPGFGLTRHYQRLRLPGQPPGTPPRGALVRAPGDIAMEALRGDVERQDWSAASRDILDAFPEGGSRAYDDARKLREK